VKKCSGCGKRVWPWQSGAKDMIIAIDSSIDSDVFSRYIEGPMHLKCFLCEAEKLMRERIGGAGTVADK